MATYSPAVLIVDDDISITRYLRQKFHEQTSVGVLVANDLAEARGLVDDQDLGIDAIVADLNFEKAPPVADEDLVDGIDLLNYCRNHREGLKHYVLSFWSDAPGEHEKADSLQLPIERWMPKMFYSDPADPMTPWAILETDLIESRAPGAADTLRKLKTPLRTFLQHLNSPGFEAIRPIEVICLQEAGGRFRSYPLKIGILEKGEGETVGDSLDNLASIILDHYLSFEGDGKRLRDYALEVKQQLEAHVRRKG